MAFGKQQQQQQHSFWLCCNLQVMRFAIRKCSILIVIRLRSESEQVAQTMQTSSFVVDELNFVRIECDAQFS